MRNLLTASAKFSTNRWKINVQKDGVRKSFYSSIPGKRGKAEAEAKAMEWLNSHTYDDPTFEVAWADYIESRRLKIGTTGKTMDAWAGNKYLLPALGKKKLSKITVQNWQDILDNAAEAGKSRATLYDIKCRITGFRKFCLKKRWPCENLELLEVNCTKKKEKRILAPDQVKTVFNNSNTVLHGEVVRDHYWNMYRLALAYGYRRGELCGFKWSDLQEDCWLTVNRSINHHLEETSGKNENARRTVRLNAFAKEILADQKAYLQSQGIISPWIFPDERGNVSHPDVVYQSWQRYLRCHDIDPISFHELRHTMISMNKKLPIELLKALVGHSGAMDTFGIYGHIIDEDRIEAADCLENAMKSFLA